MRIVSVIALGLGVIFTSMTSAQERLDADIQAAQAESFKFFDVDADGKVNAKEVLAGAKTILTALDADENGGASVEEFVVFSMGFEALAETNTQKAAYHAARLVIFTRWDMNGDLQLVESEIAAALLGELFVGVNTTEATYGNTASVAELQAALKVQ